jgi:ADP-heptose:LPS heptosyltransferase
VADLRGQLSLQQQASLIAKSRCFVASDSGPVQIAGATETPIVAMFTTTPGWRSIPYRHGEAGWNATVLNAPISCMGCREELAHPVTYLDCKFGHNDCIRSFDPLTVAVQVLASIDCDRRN